MVSIGRAHARATLYSAAPLALALAGGCILEEPAVLDTAAALDLEAEAALDEARQDQETPDFTTQAICGANDLVSVNEFAGKHGITTRFVRREKIPVGKYFTGNGGECSGTLISHDLFLTASHCVPDIPSQITQGQVQFGLETDGWASDALPSRTFAVAALVEDRLTGDDYAILRLSGMPGLTYGHNVLADYSPAEGSAITIIGHPDGNPKQVDVGHVDYHEFSDFIYYDDLDTLGGSSGSGILDANGELVGVHRGPGCRAIHDSARSTPSVREPGEPPIPNANHGTKMIHLLEASPTLRAAPRHLIVSQPDTGIYIINGGAKMHIGTMEEYDALGLRHADHRVLTVGSLSSLPTAPRDGTVLRTKEGGIYLVYGGARFWIPTMDELNALGLSWPDVQPAPTVALNALPLIPQNETLLKERSSDGVYVVRWGQRYGIPSWEAFLAHGFQANRIRTVPDGSLNQIPYAGALP